MRSVTKVVDVKERVKFDRSSGMVPVRSKTMKGSVDKIEKKCGVIYIYIICELDGNCWRGLRTVMCCDRL